MEKFTPDSMSKNERSALLYAESCAVDRSGLLQGARINADDIAVFKAFEEHGLMKFGRIPARLIGCVGGEPSYYNTHWVTLTDAGWALAGQCRQLRSKQIGQNRLQVDAALAEMAEAEPESALAQQPAP